MTAVNPQPQPQYVVAGPQLKNGLGTAALVCGIVGVVFALIPILFFISFPLGILGVVFGAVGMSRVRRKVANNRGMAVAGFILGIIAFVLAIIGAVAIGSAVDDLNNDLNSASAGATSFPHAQMVANHEEHMLIRQGVFVGNDF